jgi:hypothetical protein
MSCSELISGSFCSPCSVRGSATVDSKSEDPTMMMGEEVLDHEGDHWLGRGRVRGIDGVIIFIRLLVFSFPLVVGQSRVAWFIF